MALVVAIPKINIKGIIELSFLYVGGIQANTEIHFSYENMGAYRYVFSVRIKSSILLYLIYVRKFCPAFIVQGINYLISLTNTENY